MRFCPACGHSLGQEATVVCPQCGVVLIPPLVQPATPPASNPSPAVPAETSGLAIASLVCGILFLFLPAAIGAVITGHLSRAEIRRSGGRKNGAGMALAGLILGYLGVTIIPVILLIAAIALPNLLRAKMQANEAAAQQSLRLLCAASLDYSTTYGNYPPSLAALGPSASPSAAAADLIDSELASGAKSGYTFHYDLYSVTDPQENKTFSRYRLRADPVSPGSTGTRHFYMDQTEVMRFESNGPASDDSPRVE